VRRECAINGSKDLGETREQVEGDDEEGSVGFIRFGILLVVLVLVD